MAIRAARKRELALVRRFARFQDAETHGAIHAAIQDRRLAEARLAEWSEDSIVNEPAED